MIIWRKPFLLLLAGVVAFYALAPWLTGSVAWRETLLLSALYVVLVSNLNLVIGYTGYVNFGNIVFFGLGGYLGVFLATRWDWPLYLAAPTAGAFTSLLALLLGSAILRLRGPFFALATIGVAEAVKAFVSNFEPWGGAAGLYMKLSAFAPLGGTRTALWVIYFLMVATMAASLLLAWWVKNSKFGLGLFAIREDEDAAQVLGVGTARAKTVVYAVSAFLPAVAGTLFFFKNGVIEPEQAFDLNLSIEAIVMLMLGGQGTVTGAALGAVVYEQMRGYLLTSELFSSFHLVIAGGLLLLTVLFVPGGLLGLIHRRWPRTLRILE